MLLNDPKSLLNFLCEGSVFERRKALAKLITLAESSRPEDRSVVIVLLEQAKPVMLETIRIGISGPPGVGKSTLIEALGLRMIAQGHRVAVLTVDPSSQLSGGSILGDKTRMEKLAIQPESFIRSSPSRGHLGGVSLGMREAILFCEMAQYDVIIVETVGVGQSEIDVATMTDLFILLQLPNSGDILQGIKMGIMEHADIILVNKADIDLNLANRTQGELASAKELRMTSSQWQTPVLLVSAQTHQGLDELGTTIKDFKAFQKAHQEFNKKRGFQNTRWTWDLIINNLIEQIKNDPEISLKLSALIEQVQSGTLFPPIAAEILTKSLKDKR